jgi:hypothetical protein
MLGDGKLKLLCWHSKFQFKAQFFIAMASQNGENTEAEVPSNKMLRKCQTG